MARLETDTESIEWMNAFLVKFWPIYSPVVCATIVGTVDQVLSTTKPAMLDGLRLKTFTLGSKPPRMEFVKAYPKTEDDVVLMDWKFSFTPNDTADMTARQLKVKTNPKVVLEARIGRGLVSKGMDVIVENMSCVGHIQLKIKLQVAFPHVERVDMCFLGPPEFDYSCKPLGGDMLGMDVGFIPGLTTFIKNTIHDNLGPMMYSPNVFPIEVAKMLAGDPVDQAIGVVSISLHGCDIPDKSNSISPYAVVSINGRQPLGRTKQIDENSSPKWNENINILISSLADTLTITVFDGRGFRKNKEIGVATFLLSKFENEKEHVNMRLKLFSGGGLRGSVHLDVRFFPVLKESKGPDGVIVPPPETNTGILRFSVEQAKELDATKSIIGRLNPYAVLLLNGNEVHISKKLKRTNQPVFPDASKELLITSRATAKLGLIIKDDRDLAADPIVGSYQIKVNDMLDLMSKGQNWFNLAGVASGRVKMTAQWRPVALKGVIAGAGAYVPPIGVVRLRIKHARDLRNVETIGKSDPYVSILLSGVLKARTVTFRNNLNPDWNEVFYIPVHSVNESITLDVRDEEELGTDPQLGATDIMVSNWAKKDESGQFTASPPVEVSRTLKSGKGEKGVLTFTAGFYPTIPVVDPDVEEEEKRKSIDEEKRKSIDGEKRRSGEASRPDDDEKRKSTEASRPDDESTGPPGSHNTTGSDYVVLPQTGSDRSGSGDEHGDASNLAPSSPPPPPLPAPIRLTPETLEQYDSGLLVFRLLDGEFLRTNTQLQLLVDDDLFPTYESENIKTTNHTFNEFGDLMIRELEFSRITFRLVGFGPRQRVIKPKDILAIAQGGALPTIQRGLYTPTTIELRHDDGKVSRLNLSFKYIPIKMTLPARDSIHNQGTLSVHLKRGVDLPAADRNGFSDPFCLFILNENTDKPVYESQKIKKTLNPEWNESFKLDIRSRADDKLAVDVYDYDLADSNDFLGRTLIPLDDIEPFQMKTLRLPLDGKSGEIELDVVFQSAFVTRTRLGTKTFQGKTFVGAPVNVVASGVTGVGRLGVTGVKGVASGFRNLGSGLGRSKPSAQEIPETPSMDRLDSGGGRTSGGDNGRSPTHSRHRSLAPSITGGAGSGPTGEAGRVSVSIISLTGPWTNAPVAVSVVMLNGKKEKDVTSASSKTNGSGQVVFNTEPKGGETSAATQFKVMVSEPHRFGRNIPLGEGFFFLPDQGTSSPNVDVQVGTATVSLQVKFTPNESDEGNGSLTPGRRRLSMLGRRSSPPSES